MDFEAIVRYLRQQGYQGWYVLEQDTILTEEPRGEGPLTDVRTSVEYLRGAGPDQVGAGWSRCASGCWVPRGSPSWR